MTPEAEVAYHEAGHAVVANALGISVARVSIRSKKGALGAVHYVTASLEQNVIIGLAGPIAEYRYKAKPNDVACYIGKWGTTPLWVSSLKISQVSLLTFAQILPGRLYTATGRE